MPQVIFWDVDTQVDFMLPGRPLYVSGAEEILPQLNALTGYARAMGIRRLGSEDSHGAGDPEISDQPDWRVTFPPHCLAGSEGQRRVAQTLPTDPLYVESAPIPRATLIERIRSHPGEILFRKQTFDVFQNPNVHPVLEILHPAVFVVYGVALDVCVRDAIRGFLKRGSEELFLVTDATRALDRAERERLLSEWSRAGVNLVMTADVLAGRAAGERITAG